jgi:hypothetical protein
VRRSARLLLAALACATAAWAFLAAPEDGHEPRGTFAARLLGPLAPVLAAIEWGGFDAAVEAGDEAAAWRHADRALLLAPDAAAGWTTLAHHAVWELGNPRRTPDAAGRQRAVELGLAILARGEIASADPGRVAFKTGVVYLSLANQDDADRALPLGRREAWTRAAEAFERAAAAGEPVAAEAARLCRAEALAAGG